MTSPFFCRRSLRDQFEAKFTAIHIVLKTSLQTTTDRGAISDYDTVVTQPDDLTVIEQQLGRPPDGFQEVMRRNADGLPAIIRVASMVDGTPFPTLFWMSDPGLSQLVYKYESKGTTQLIQDRIDDSQERQNRMRRDNENYIRLRESYFSDEVRNQIADLELETSFDQKGIGGNSNFLRVRCLHAYLAAHLVSPNIVGELITDCLGKEDPLVIALDQFA